MTTIEVATRKTKQSAQAEVNRLNARALEGQVYSAQEIDARLFSIVLIDKVANPADVPASVRRNQFNVDERMFYSLAGRRSHRSQRGFYRVYA